MREMGSRACMSSMVGHTRARAQTSGSRVSTTPQLQQPTRVQPAASTDSSLLKCERRRRDRGANRTVVHRRRGVWKKRSQERRKRDVSKVLGKRFTLGRTFTLCSQGTGVKHKYHSQSWETRPDRTGAKSTWYYVGCLFSFILGSQTHGEPAVLTSAHADCHQTFPSLSLSCLLVCKSETVWVNQVLWQLAKNNLWEHGSSLKDKRLLRLTCSQTHTPKQTLSHSSPLVSGLSKPNPVTRW